MSASNTHPVRLALLAVLAVPTFAFATNGYQLIGVGSYQKSLGGAVTANPGSAMTAITNPAGMIRIGKRADFSMEAMSAGCSTTQIRPGSREGSLHIRHRTSSLRAKQRAHRRTPRVSGGPSGAPPQWGQAAESGVMRRDPLPGNDLLDDRIRPDRVHFDS